MLAQRVRAHGATPDYGSLSSVQINDATNQPANPMGRLGHLIFWHPSPFALWAGPRCGRHHEKGTPPITAQLLP